MGVNDDGGGGFVHTLSAQKYELVHALLALLYGVFFWAVLFFLLFRGQFRSRPYFNLLLLTGVVLRIVWLVLQAFLQAGQLSLSRWHDWYFVLNTLPSFLFFSCFFIVLFLWVLVFHTRIRQAVVAPSHRPPSSSTSSNMKEPSSLLPPISSSSPSASSSSSPLLSGSRLTSYHSAELGSPPLASPAQSAPLAISSSPYRKVFVAINVLMYGTLIVFYAADYVKRSSNAFEDGTQLTWAERAALVLESSVYVLSSAGFAVYGFLFRAELIRMRATAVRRRILAKVQRLTLVTVVCFTSRAAIIVWAVVAPNWKSWYFDFLYFGGLELFPLTLMIVILHTGLGTAPRTVVIPNHPSQPASKSVQY